MPAGSSHELRVETVVPPSPPSSSPPSVGSSAPPADVSESPDCAVPPSPPSAWESRMLQS